MKIIAFGASTSRNSINKSLAIHAAKIAADEMNADVEILDLNDFDMPIYSTDYEKQHGIPDNAQAFYNKLGAANALIISYAEHNGGYTAAFKNIFDWTSRINPKVYQGKDMVVFSTSPGPGGAQSVLESAKNSAAFFAANVKASLSIASFYDVFDQARGTFKKPDVYEAVRATVLKLFEKQ